MFDLFGKKSKAKAEILAKENAELTEKLIEFERKNEELTENLRLSNSREDDYRNVSIKLERQLAKVNDVLDLTEKKLDAYTSEEENLLSKFVSEVASDYPNVTNGKLRAYVDTHVTDIMLADKSKNKSIKVESYFMLKTINNLQKYLDANNLTVRKK